ncbi:TIGR03915 family putative DNA repair protein [Gorillibacterium massiliense]|uniref:TIGR03915 family putative DNA repair protein n=1 Tax=Gorillibacterium massiliense TaxID=1280390 RepID=UPI0004B4456E|nr:TIGR03915 family putative DNA repair protein [Gorillibacterium massiliense]
MPNRSDLVYGYDGSFDGLLTCIFESFACKDEPLDIVTEETLQLSLFDTKWIETDMEKAARVKTGILRKIGKPAFEMTERGHLTCHPQKDLLVWRFVRLGFLYGRSVVDRLTDETVITLQKAVLALNSENHHYLGFIRFSIYNQVMIAIIEPQNQVLPLLEEHFSSRFPEELFLIFDKTHGKALVHRPGESVITDLDDLTLPQASDEEEKFRQLWQRFYETIGIKERDNPKARMSHMPKRYWKHMTEFMEMHNDTSTKQKDQPNEQSGLHAPSLPEC